MYVNSDYIYSSPHERLEIEQCGVELLKAGGTVQVLQTDLGERQDGMLVLFKTT